MTTAAPTRRPEADTEEVGRRPSRERAVPSAVRCEDLLPVTTVSTVAVMMVSLCESRKSASPVHR